MALKDKLNKGLGTEENSRSESDDSHSNGDIEELENQEKESVKDFNPSKVIGRMKWLLQDPADSSVLGLLRKGNSDKKFNSSALFKKSLGPELLGIAEDEDVPIMSYIVMRLALSKKQTNAAIEELASAFKEIDNIPMRERDLEITNLLFDKDFKNSAEAFRHMRKVATGTPAITSLLMSLK